MIAYQKEGKMRTCIGLVMVVGATVFYGFVSVERVLGDGTPDASPPSQENGCNGLSGAAFGLCNAYCEAQDCDVYPQPSCTRLRENFQKVTGNPIFPCDAFCGDGVLNQAAEECDPPGSPSCPEGKLCGPDCTCPTGPLPSCNDTNPGHEEIEAAVLEVIIPGTNPWGNLDDFALFLAQLETELGCSLGEGPTSPVVASLELEEQGCAAAGVDYCGPGTSENGIAVPGAPACLNEACCQHDTCYGRDCVEGPCWFTSQSQECDDSPGSVLATCNLAGSCGILDLLHPSAVVVCTLVNCFTNSLDPRCVAFRIARLVANPECSDPPTCECAGQTCETFTTCNPGSPCSNPVCGSTAEGGGLCVEGATPCAGLADCGTSADCDPGVCFVNSCCVRSVCVDPVAFCPDIGAADVVPVIAATEEATIGGR